MTQFLASLQISFKKLTRQNICLHLYKAQTPRYTGYEGVWGAGKSLTMTYFHTGIRTIIGAKSFHCPVRDGKEWYQLAMVIRHNLLLSSCDDCPANS